MTVEPHGRNPILADILKRIGLAEKTGRGIDRIFEGQIVYGRRWPDYSESTSRYVRVFLHAIIKVQSKSPLLSAPILLGEKVMALSYIWLIKAQ